MEMLRIPEWLIPWVTGSLLFYAVVYLFITPTLTQRAIELHIEPHCNRNGSTEMCTCLFNGITQDRAANALFIASLGFSDSRPRQSTYRSSDNGYVQFIAREVADPARREHCAQPSADVTTKLQEQRRAQEEALAAQLAAQEKAAAEALKQQREQYKKTLQAQQQLTKAAEQERKRLYEEHQRQLKEAAEKVRQKAIDAHNCELGDNVFVEDAERKCRLAKDTNSELMNWGEWALDQSKKFRNYLNSR